MDDFSMYAISFDHCMNNLSKMLQQSEDVNLVLNWRSAILSCKRGLTEVILSLTKALRLTKKRWR